MPGVQQVRVGQGTGLSCSEAYRAAVLHQPDVVLVDELEDADAARGCREASMAGRLVIATMVAQDIAGVVQRLLLLGMEGPVIAAVLVGVHTQRLVRLSCPVCSEERQIAVAPLARLRQTTGTADLPRLERAGAGCDACGQTGYRGREALGQTTLISDELRHCLYESDPVPAVAGWASENTEASLAGAARLKIEQATTTAAEVLAAMGCR